MKFERGELAEGLKNLNGLLSYIKKVEGTDDFPVIITDWYMLDERQKMIVALMAMSMLAEYLIKEEQEK